ncbi:Serine/threonine-protein kinase RIO1 [Quaeritorhiza haematococci]|nr:Serine/threonine-protein kinase RIO1 [Quaeritorhiza haematococci]
MNSNNEFESGQFSDAEEDELPTQVASGGNESAADTAQKSDDGWARLDDDHDGATEVADAVEPDMDDFVNDEDVDVDYDDDDYFDDDDFDLAEGHGSGDLTKQYNRIRQTNNSNSAPSQKVKSGVPSGNVKSGAQSKQTASNDASAMAQLTKKFADRIRVDDDYSGYSKSVSNNVKMSKKKAEGPQNRNTDKSDRATVEQVLDPRTRIILLKMLNRNAIYEINGCISTGKEANVYHASTDNGQHRAIKVYKTSILVFKDRDRYVTGEFRFRHGYNKSNPRKMVKVWAEKEMRNLKRLHAVGIPCPEPLLLRMHVLLMGFIGDKNGWPAPRLKDATISDINTVRDLYMKLLKIVWKMYHQCKLIHADLSEYNILYYKKELYIIDVSQSVEHDHPHALEFLRKDCTNVVDFFRRRLAPNGIPVMNVRDLFEFVVKDIKAIRRDLGMPEKGETAKTETVEVDPANTESAGVKEEIDTAVDEVLDQYLEMVHDLISNRPQEASAASQIEEEVFKKVYIPRTLDEVADVERDIERINRGEGGALLYKSVVGLDTRKTDSQSTENTTKHSTPAPATSSTSSATLSKTAPAPFTLSSFLATIPMSKSANQTETVAATPSTSTPAASTATSSAKAMPKSLKDDERKEDASEDDEEGDTADDGSEGDESGDEDGSEEGRSGKKKVLKKEEDKQAKKERKKAAKQEQRLKREMKVPKAVKKRREKVAAEKAKGKGKK